MKFAKCMSLMAIGAGMTLAYQKYNKPVMRAVKKNMNKMDKKIDELEDMM